MKPKFLQPTEEFVSEEYIDFENRYMGFGKKLYKESKQQLPEIFDKLTFYKRQILQEEDSYAEYNNGQNWFVIQLDPLIEIIVLWNENTRTEIGTWEKDEYKPAINFIKTALLKNDEFS